MSRRSLFAKPTEIARLRNARDWSQERLATEAGISERCVQSAESLNKQPGREKHHRNTLQRIADALEVSLDDIAHDGTAEQCDFDEGKSLGDSANRKGGAVVVAPRLHAGIKVDLDALAEEEVAVILSAVQILLKRKQPIPLLAAC